MAWLMTILLTICYAASIIDRSIIAFLAQHIRRDLGISDFQLGLVQGFAFSVFYAVAAIPLGWAIDRFSRRNLIAAAMIVWSAMTMVCAFARSFTMLTLGRVGVGAGEAALTPGAYSIMGDTVMRRQFPIASMIYSLGGPIASAGAAALSGTMLAHASQSGTITLPLLGVVADWRAVLIVASVPGVFLALILLLMPEPRRADACASNAAQRSSMVKFLRAHWRTHVVYACVAMFTVLIAYCFSAWSPSLLTRKFGWSAADVGTALGLINLLCGVAGCLLGGMLASWLVRRQQPSSILFVLVSAMAIMGLCGVFVPLLGSGRQYVVIASIAGTVSPLLFMVTATFLQLITPSPLRGRMMALFMFINVGIGAGAGPTLVGAFSTYVFSPAQLPLAMGTVLMGASCIAGFGFLALFRPIRSYCADRPLP
jgi:MFS family permease